MGDENWWQVQSKEYLHGFLRGGMEGEENPTRKWLGDYFGRKTFLDCGCGSGVDYEYISKLVDYIGMDVTPKMVDVCREKFPEGRFVQGSIENIPFPDNAFDIVYARHVLEHLPYYERAVTEMKRVARKQTIIVLFHVLGDEDKIIPWPNNIHDNYYARDKFLDFMGPHQMFKTYSGYPQEIFVWSK